MELQIAEARNAASFAKGAVFACDLSLALFAVWAMNSIFSLQTDCAILRAKAAALEKRVDALEKAVERLEDARFRTPARNGSAPK